MSKWIKSKTHRDGSISYYSDKEKKWIENVRIIPENEQKDMTPEELKYLMNYLAKHN